MDEQTKIEATINLREMMKGYTDLIEPTSTDQQLLKPQPSLEKNYGKAEITLKKDFESIIKEHDIWTILNERKTIRRYGTEEMTLLELSFLLWATQGVKEVHGQLEKRNACTVRTVPSAGARHALETYLIVNQAGGLEPGVYHYLPLGHKLEFLHPLDNQVNRVAEASCGQYFFAGAPVIFLWTAVPYRSEWRYGNCAQKYILLDVGHVCQNLYLASQAIGCGTCAIGAYQQQEADGLLGLSYEPSEQCEDEFVVYMASVGKLNDKQ